jgi:prepilin-type N-terminal cleavage/methylation domain-containing protein
VRRRYDERGETLLEIVIALVVIGIVVGAFFAAYSTAAVTSTTHRSAAQSDAILRDAAEATKSAVRDQCANAIVSTPGATYVTTTTSLPPGFSLTATSSPPGQACQPVTGLQQVRFSLTAPGAAPRSLTIQVRTP